MGSLPSWLRPGWLRRDWTRPRATPAQVRSDAGLGALAAVSAVLAAELYRSGYGAGVSVREVETYLYFGLAGLALAGRRALPLSTMLVQATLFILIGERLGILGATFPIQMILFAAMYAAWAWSPHPRRLLAATVLVLAAMFFWLLYRLLEPGVLPTEDMGGRLDPAASVLTYSVLINVVYFFGAIAWGQMAWRGARTRQAAEQQVSLELALAEEQRERAVSDERVRIARDLHDVVAHHVSSIGIQASGAQRVLAVDPDAAREALATIGSSSREAVSQMHQLVHLLRDPEEGRGQGRAPQPGLAEIAALATCSGSLQVEHRQVGTPFAVPPTTALSLYRVAQEALTNVRRHAAARHASVVLRYLEDPRAVEVEVVDDGRGAPGQPGPRSSGGQPAGGFGLTGITERAELHGGDSEIGPRPQGGFRVRVRLPVGAP